MELLGGIRGCTYLTELVSIFPTAAIQAFVGEVLPTRVNASNDDRAE
jgi:hypothetical protein